MSSSSPARSVRRPSPRRARLLSLVVSLPLLLVAATAGAAPWTVEGLEGGVVETLVRAPAAPEIVFAAGIAGGLHRSDHGGITWESLFDRLPVAEPRAVGVGPVGDRVLVLDGATLHRSDDGGDTWTAVEVALGFSTFLQIAPSDADVAYATGEAGTWRTVDGGDTWDPVAPDWAALVAEPARHHLRRLAVDPDDAHRVLGVDPEGTVLLTDDGGATWQVVLEDTSPNDVGFHPGSPDFVAVAAYTRVWLSEDGGLTWSARREQFEFRDFTRVEADPAEPGSWRVVARTEVGGPPPDIVWSVFDVGADGAQWNQEMGRVERLTDLSAGAGQPWLVSGSEFGVEAELGDSWPPTVAGLHARPGFRVASLPSEPSKLFAAALDTGPFESGGAFYSKDGGVSWFGLYPFPGRRPLLAQEVEPAGEVHAYFLTREGVLTRTRAELNRAVIHPVAPDLNAYVALAVHPQAPNRVFVATNQLPAPPGVELFTWKLHRSTNRGETWEELDLPGDNPRIHDVVVDPGNPRWIYVSSADRDSGRVFFSGDAGDTWQVRGEGEAGLLRQLVAQPGDGPSRLLGINYRNVRRSDDGGRTWRMLSRGLPADVRLTTLAASPRARGPVVVGTRRHGVFLLGPGNTWQPLGDGLPDREVTGLQVVPGVEVVVATLDGGGGIYRHGVSRECDPGAPRLLCVGHADRFQVEIEWDVITGGRLETGFGRANELTSLAGWFWFFDPALAEVAVKVQDGWAANGYWWVFYASLSNVGFDLGVTDTFTGAFRVYRNPRKTLASQGDTRAFDARTPIQRQAVAAAAAAHREAGTGDPDPVATVGEGVELVPGSELLQPTFFVALPDSTGTACGGTENDLCLQRNRFRVEATWQDFQGGTGTAIGVPLAVDSGYLWFFHPLNAELFVKIVDGRPVNGHWWVFYGSLSNVAFEVTVTDTVTGDIQTYTNPERTFASVADTTAF